MERYATAVLIAETPAAHGVFDTATQTRTTVYCEVRSIGMKEAYTAMSQGLNPEVCLYLPLSQDYSGQKLAEYDSKSWRVLRTYMSGDGIELYLERADADV